jgi:hypothetical protein
LLVVAGATWLVLRHMQAPSLGQSITISYATMNGNTLATFPVSLRPALPGESPTEHLHNAALYAAVSAVAGPTSDVAAVRFPHGTRVLSVTVTGATAIVDLSSDVANQPGGTFGENGEFKALVYTLTALPGIDAVQVTVQGRKLDTLPGGHLELDQPLHRSDW